MPDDKGETRRQRNTRFDEPSPDVEVPDQGHHLWSWFWDLAARRQSGPEPITHGEVADWLRLTGRLVLPEEVEILMAMDDSYLRVVREEQKYQRERAMDEARTKGKYA